MLRIINLEEIQGLLLRISALVDLQEQRDIDFVPNVKKWLVNIEKVLENNRISAAGNVAALRGVLIEAERGMIPTNLTFHGRTTSRKTKEATAADVLHQAGNLISGVIQKDLERIAEAECLARQLIALGKAKGLISGRPSGADHTGMLREIWRTLSTDPDIAGGAISLEGLVGPNEALVVLDRGLTKDIKP